MADLREVQHLALELIAHHLSSGWSFGFDTAKKRAGACNFTQRRITLSRHLAERHSLDDMRQTLLHEIAHAQVGPGAGHGIEWRAAARALGYVGGTTHTLATATEFARWVGECPGGHAVLRFRRPDTRRARSCARCSPRFDRRFLIVWRERTASERLADARAARGSAAVG